MNDPRYETDPAYRQDVFDALERSNIHTNDRRKENPRARRSFKEEVVKVVTAPKPEPEVKRPPNAWPPA